MSICVLKYERGRISDVVDFERELRRQEPDTYFWDIDETYIKSVEESFDDGRFDDSAVSLLAYDGEKVVGRADAGIICSRFDGNVSQAYLDWICVLKSERHKGVGKALLEALKDELKKRGVSSLIVLTAGNDESVSFYDSLEDISFCRGATVRIL